MSKNYCDVCTHTEILRKYSSNEKSESHQLLRSLLKFNNFITARI